MKDCCTYRDRVEARRSYETRELTRTLYGIAAALAIVDVAMAVFVAVYLGGLK